MTPDPRPPPGVVDGKLGLLAVHQVGCAKFRRKWRLEGHLRPPISTKFGATDKKRCGESESAIRGPVRLLGVWINSACIKEVALLGEVDAQILGIQADLGQIVEIAWSLPIAGRIRPKWDRIQSDSVDVGLNVPIFGTKPTSNCHFGQGLGRLGPISFEAWPNSAKLGPGFPEIGQIWPDLDEVCEQGVDTNMFGPASAEHCQTWPDFDFDLICHDVGQVWTNRNRGGGTIIIPERWLSNESGTPEQVLGMCRSTIFRTGIRFLDFARVWPNPGNFARTMAESGRTRANSELGLGTPRGSPPGGLY